MGLVKTKEYNSTVNNNTIKKVVTSFNKLFISKMFFDANVSENKAKNEPFAMLTKLQEILTILLVISYTAAKVGLINNAIMKLCEFPIITFDVFDKNG